MSKQRRLSMDRLEERTNPAPVAVGFGQEVFDFNIAGFILRQANADSPSTSSAFGFHDASMTAAGAVDTLSGGTTLSTLTDAFDGALAWGLPDSGKLPSTVYVDADGIVDITPAPTGPGTSTTTAGTAFTGGPETIGSDGSTFNGLQFQQQNAVFTVNGDPVIRTILSVTNPTGAAITQEIGSFNDVGSDFATAIFTTSDGDDVFTDGSDRWYVNFQQFGFGGEGQEAPPNVSVDPRLLFVLQGPGAVASPVSSNGSIVASNDRPTFLYTLTVNPGETQSLMIFASLHQTRAEAAGFGATFDDEADVRAAGLVSDLSQAQLDQIQNWTFDATIIPPPPPAPPPGIGPPGAGPQIATSTEGNAGWIERVYHDLLGRRPDSFADAYVLDLDNGSRSRLEIATEIAHSDEYLARVVAHLYDSYLGRAPDETSLFEYVNAIQDGKSVEDVAIEILSSAEYRSQSHSAEGYVANLFHDVLGREPSPEDLEVYVQKYGGGSQEEAAAVAREIVESNEARGISVDAAFQLMMNRPADELSRISYVGVLDGDRSILDILAEMAASIEYGSSNLLI